MRNRRGVLSSGDGDVIEAAGNRPASGETVRDFILILKGKLFSTKGKKMSLFLLSRNISREKTSLNFALLECFCADILHLAVSPLAHSGNASYCLSRARQGLMTCFA